MSTKLLLANDNNTYYSYIDNNDAVTKLNELQLKNDMPTCIYDSISNSLTSMNTPNLSNYYALNFTSDRDDCLTVNQDIYLTSQGIFKHTGVIQDDNKTYVIMDNNVVKACQYPYNMVSGMLHDI
jgi:hypothetical protein